MIDFEDGADRPLATDNDELGVLRKILATNRAALLDLQAIRTTLAAFLKDWLAVQENPNQAVTAVVTPPGGPMPLTVDSTGQSLILTFEDDHGDATAPPSGDGSGLVVTLTSDNPSVASVGTAVQGTDAAGNVNYSAPLTFGVDGSFNAGATVANTSGAALLDDDGVTPFVQPASVPVTVAAGQATTGDVSEAPGGTA
jgi:hypothetical protein